MKLETKLLAAAGLSALSFAAHAQIGAPHIELYALGGGFAGGLIGALLACWFCCRRKRDGDDITKR